MRIDAATRRPIVGTEVTVEGYPPVPLVALHRAGRTPPTAELLWRGEMPSIQLGNTTGRATVPKDYTYTGTHGLIGNQVRY